MSITSYIFGRKYGADFLEGLVAYYPLNSNANDSINGYNGTQVGTPTFVSGKVDNAINFGNDTIVRYVNIADNNDFSFTNGTTDVPFTISTWVNFSSFSSTGNWLINKRNTTSGGDEWQLIITPTGEIRFYKFQFNLNTSYQIVATPASTIALNTWYHITVTDAGTANINDCKIYVNGVLNTVTRTTIGTYTRMNNGSSLVRLGMSSWNAVDANLKHRGLLDEIAIWKNRELTATEVLELYNKGNAGLPLI